MTPDKGQAKMEFGNAMAKIRESAGMVDTANQRFKEAQDHGGEDYRRAKRGLQQKLDLLNEELNQYLAADYGKKEKGYEEWLASHRPLHWITEFYGIIQNSGGFDVVIGNPPYVEYSKVRDIYTIQNYETESCGNLYAYIMERSKQLTASNGPIGMIVPLSGHSTKRMQTLIDCFYKKTGLCYLFNISADAHPSILFPGVKFRLGVFIATNSGHGTTTTRYTRWYSEKRNSLFSLLDYVDIQGVKYPTAVPKIANSIHLGIFNKIAKQNKTISNLMPANSRTAKNGLYYHSAPVNWIRAHTNIPYFTSERDGEKKSVQLTFLPTSKTNDIQNLQAVLCSTLFFIWWQSHSDCYHLNKPEIHNFPYNESIDVYSLSQELEESMRSNSKIRVYNYRTTGRVEYDEFYMKQSKKIIDKIDMILAKHYNFTDEELDYIINYDIKYRMGLGND